MLGLNPNPTLHLHKIINYKEVLDGVAFTVALSLKIKHEFPFSIKNQLYDSHYIENKKLELSNEIKDLSLQIIR